MSGTSCQYILYAATLMLCVSHVFHVRVCALCVSVCLVCIGVLRGGRSMRDLTPYCEDSSTWIGRDCPRKSFPGVSVQTHGKTSNVLQVPWLWILVIIFDHTGSCVIIRSCDHWIIRSHDQMIICSNDHTTI